MTPGSDTSDGPALYLFEDARAREWDPFHLTRPVGELLYGCLLLRERAERFWDVDCRGHLAGEELLGFTEPGAPPTLVLGQVPVDVDRVLVSSRVVPDLEEAPRLHRAPGEGAPKGGGEDRARSTGEEGTTAGRPRALTLEGEVVGWHIPAGAPNPRIQDLLEPGRGGYEAPLESSVPLVGRLLHHPWDLISGNPERIRRDVPLLFPHSSAFLPPEAEQ
ncbi:MAG: putative sugar nucleotidyl transferase, partial [Longimicrobiales bacterium]|nr:putative sugar nucleotidyl transferase [Longimicrobiales bacterium]